MSESIVGLIRDRIDAIPSDVWEDAQAGTFMDPTPLWEALDDIDSLVVGVAARAASREHVAWLLYCVSEGYISASDRAGMDNWLLKDPASLHPDDAALRPHLLAMADEVLVTLAENGSNDTGSTP